MILARGEGMLSGWDGRGVASARCAHGVEAVGLGRRGECVGPPALGGGEKDAGVRRSCSGKGVVVF